MFKNLLIILLLVSLSTNCTRKKDSSDSKVISFSVIAIPHMDPIQSVNTITHVMNSAIFEGLYHYDYLKRPLTIEPLLAESLPEVSQDKLTYTISLKPGVVFQDDEAFPNSKGREVTANDFIYSWKRLADPKNKSLGWWTLNGKIAGLNEWRKLKEQGKADYDTPVSGLTAIDSHKLQIILTKPSYQFIHLLTMAPTMVTAKEVVDHYGDTITSHPVGTGPFKLKQWVRKSKIHLVKNPTYRKEFYPSEGSEKDKQLGLLKDAGKTLPLSNEIIIRVFTEKEPLWLSFLKGELDHGTIPKDNYDQVIKDGKLIKQYSDKGIYISDLYRPDVVYIGANTEHPVLGNNKYLRKALASAIDKELILDKFYNGRGMVAHSPIPPNFDAYKESYKSPIDFDLNKAKDYLVKAGYPGGKGLPVFDYDLQSNMMWARQMATFLKDQWGKIGVKLKIRPNTWPQFNKKLNSKQTTLYDQAWTADYPDTENFMQMFYSKNRPPGPNTFNFHNHSFDQLYEKMLETPAGPQRDQLFRQMVDILNEEVPAIFTVHRVFKRPVHKWLKNFHYYPMIFDHYKYLRVDQKEKQRMKSKL